MTLKSLFRKIFSWFYPKKLTTTTINIMVKGKVVGHALSLSVLETNSDADAPRTINANRIRFSKAQVEEAFYRGLVHKSSQKLPLQIKVDDGKVETTIHNAWIEEVDTVYSAGNYTIVDWAKLVAEDIFTKKK